MATYDVSVGLLGPAVEQPREYADEGAGSPAHRPHSPGPRRRAYRIPLSLLLIPTQTRQKNKTEDIALNTSRRGQVATVGEVEFGGFDGGSAGGGVGAEGMAICCKAAAAVDGGGAPK